MHRNTPKTSQFISYHNQYEYVKQNRRLWQQNSDPASSSNINSIPFFSLYKSVSPLRRQCTIPYDSRRTKCIHPQKRLPIPTLSKIQGKQVIHKTRSHDPITDKCPHSKSYAREDFDGETWRVARVQCHRSIVKKVQDTDPGKCFCDEVSKCIIGRSWREYKRHIE